MHHTCTRMQRKCPETSSRSHNLRQALLSVRGKYPQSNQVGLRPRCQSLLSSPGRPGRVTTSTLPLTSITCFCNRSSPPSPVSQPRRAPGASDAAGGWMPAHHRVSDYKFGRMNTIIGIILAKEMSPHLNCKSTGNRLGKQTFHPR